MGTRHDRRAKMHPHGDIDEVGDSSHCTFFERLGNWSLGDYFKKKPFPGAGIPSPVPNGWALTGTARLLRVRGDETRRATKKRVPLARRGREGRPHLLSAAQEQLVGPRGTTGPCGPTPRCSSSPTRRPAARMLARVRLRRYLEIWNDVFMQYNKQPTDPTCRWSRKTSIRAGPREHHRRAADVKSVYETDLFTDIVAKICALSGKTYGEDEETTVPSASSPTTSAPPPSSSATTAA
jgi:alanyl-tRNA synthetase